jgi:hypothetical protein
MSLDIQATCHVRAVAFRESLKKLRATYTALLQMLFLTKQRNHTRASHSRHRKTEKRKNGTKNSAIIIVLNARVRFFEILDFRVSSITQKILNSSQRSLEFLLLDLHCILGFCSSLLRF